MPIPFTRCPGWAYGRTGGSISTFCKFSRVSWIVWELSLPTICRDGRLPANRLYPANGKKPSFGRCARPSTIEDTLDNLQVNLYRRRDIEEMVQHLKNKGCAVDFDFTLGDGEADQFVDLPPYQENPHLKLLIGPYVTTSTGLIIQKGA